MLKRYNQLSTQDESRLCDPVLRARRTKPHSLEKKKKHSSVCNECPVHRIYKWDLILRKSNDLYWMDLARPFK